MSTTALVMMSATWLVIASVAGVLFYRIVRTKKSGDSPTER